MANDQGRGGGGGGRGQGQRDPNELGALWPRTTRSGQRILSGNCDGIDIICFYNERSEGNDRAPQWRIMRSTNNDRQQGGPRGNDRSARDQGWGSQHEPSRRYEGHEPARHDAGGSRHVGYRDEPQRRQGPPPQEERDWRDSRVDGDRAHRQGGTGDWTDQGPSYDTPRRGRGGPPEDI